MTLRSPWWYIAVVPPGKNAEPIDLTSRVLSFDFEDDERKTDKLRLTVNNFDLSNFDDPVWRHGAVLRVTFGNGVTQAPMREMVVKKVTGGRVLNIEANDRAVEMDTQRRRRVFENMTRSEVVRQIAQENGYDDPDIEDTPEKFEIINQGNLSDAQFMRKLAHLEGFQFFVDFDGLHWHRRRAGQAPLRTLTYYAQDPAAAGDILDFNVENDITRKPGRVRVAGRDPIEQKEFVVEADNETDTGRDSMQSFIGVFDPESAELTQQERASYESTVVSNVQTEQDAEREATGKYRLATQRAVKMTLKIRGAPDLLAKSVITVNGLGKRLSGKYYVKNVKHPLSGSSGYVSSVQLITDGYQRGFGSGGGGENGDADTLLQSCVEELRSARATITGTSSAEVQIAAQLDRLQSGVAEIAGAPSPSERTKRAARVIPMAGRLAIAARQNGVQDVGQAAQNCASVLRRLSETTDLEAKGKVNDKEAGSGGRKAVTKVDVETGQEVTSYIDTGGRDA